MFKTSLDTPILLIIFNRPDTTRCVIDALREAKPNKLYVAADGPRPGNQNDAEKCTLTRSLIETIDWDCEVVKNFSDKNLGVDKHIETAINWFFDHEERGVILEDDCIPHLDFFRFAGEMLDIYADNKRVMMISGNNFQNGTWRGNGGYYFSRYPNSWGWATWRRAWEMYDPNLSALENFILTNKISAIRPDKKEQRYWLRFFKDLQRRRYTFWDAKWVFAVWDNDGICIVPNVNLVQNIGFGANATHTLSSSQAMNIPTKSMTNLSEPSNTNTDEEADKYLFKQVFEVTILKRLKYLFTRLQNK